MGCLPGLPTAHYRWDALCRAAAEGPVYFGVPGGHCGLYSVLCLLFGVANEGVPGTHVAWKGSVRGVAASCGIPFRRASACIHASLYCCVLATASHLHAPPTCGAAGGRSS